MSDVIIRDRKIVLVNQAVNYLSVGILNEFISQYQHVALITGSIHEQGESLNNEIKISKVLKYSEGRLLIKLLNWIATSFQIFFLLLFKYRKYEVFFIPNPPISYLMMLTLPHKFSILKWDVYPDTLNIFGVTEKHFVYRIWSSANKRLFKKTFRIYTIGNKISELIAQYVDSNKITKIPLWTTFEDFIPISSGENIFIEKHQLQGKFIVQYSGNIGITHNVELLVDVAQHLKHADHIFIQIIGRGNRYNEIKLKIDKSGLENCQILPFQADDIFPHSLSAADLGIVVLDDKTSKGSVPSKTYNLMVAAKPILYIASKESELFEYAAKYNNGRCYHKSQIDKISKFILKISTDKEFYNSLSRNSLLASNDFKRRNAKKLVDHYSQIKL